jgi:hypothetical protein
MFLLPSKVTSLAAFRVIPLPDPEVVMFAPTERFVAAPVEVRFVAPVLEIAPAVEIVWHSILTMPPAEMVPAELFAKVPELQVTVIADSPLIAAFTVTLPPVDNSVNEFDELGDVTEFETVTVPADSTVVEKDCM